MPDQPELRQRLSDALHEHEMLECSWGVEPNDCNCGHGEKININDKRWGRGWSDHVADVLLALPGIAITPLPHANKDGCWSISGRNDLSVENGEVHQVLPKSSGMAVACRSPELVRKIAAALLAAARVAEEQTNA